MSFLRQSDEILSVSEFSARFKTLIKISIPELWIRGEISNLKTYSSGHTYFTLKDDNASISAVLFKGYMQNSSLKLAEGMKILAYGEISVYETRGSYQIIVKAFMPDGLGSLSEKFEALKKKLSQEGLFDSSRKKPIPDLPKKIAVITSETGAAIRDFLSILRRRNWSGEIIILPSRVQGTEAAQEIVSQIKIAQNLDLDLLILMRGGGSLEDLWSFNEEIVARAVAASAVPTISAVGHEIDFTLSDFSADLRAETPSAAAELVSSKFIELKENLYSLESEILEKIKNIISIFKEKLEAAEQTFSHFSPADRISNFLISLDDADEKLSAYVSQIILQKRNELAEVFAEFQKVSPTAKLDLLRLSLDAAERELELLSVESTLNRGYTIAQTADGKIIKLASQAPASFELRFADGKRDVYLNS